MIASHLYVPKNQLLLLDGIPRTVAQAEIIEQYIDLQGIILFEAGSQSALIERILGRARKEGRSDDQKEGILRKRMEVFEKETLAMLAHYPDSLVVRVNALQPPLLVLRDILALFADKLSC